jgi:hypothetical protein
MKKLWYENFRLTGDKMTFSRQIQVQIEAKIKKGIGPHNLRMPGIRELANSLSKPQQSGQIVSRCRIRL